MNILNLGGGGFIGSHLTKRLLDEGHHVTVVDLWTDKVADLLSDPRLTFLQLYNRIYAMLGSIWSLWWKRRTWWWT